jgi:glycosyltransferase involved in cell wall biosynthesis
LISSAVLFIHLLKVLRRYDVIYARDYHAVLIAFIPRILFKKRLVFEINGIANEERKLKGNSALNSLVSWLIRGAEYLAARYSDSIVSVTPQIASYISHQFHCPERKIEVISNGVNIEIFRPMDDEALLAHWRRKCNIGKEMSTVTFIGNLAPWQGLEFLIEVAPKLLSQVRKIKFMIIGSGVLKEELEEEVRGLGLSDYFLFTGMVNYEEIPFYINISDVCVVLKRRLRSGYSPLKLYEYMACGKPVVASRVEGLEFIEAEGIGWLVEPGDTGGLENALLKLLTDPQKRVQMGRKGFQLASSRFTWNPGALRIEKILETLA